jgi:transposase
MKSKDARSLPSESQEDLRIKTVNAVCDGMTQVKAAKTFGVSRQAIRNWLDCYQESGLSGLRARRRGRPPLPSLLKPLQAAQVVRTIEDRCPDQLHLPFYLWTREAVGDLIRRKFGVEMSVWTVGRYLKRWGFTPQKPMRRAFEQDDEQVRRWLKEEYPAIHQQAKREKAEIHWGDEMGLRSDHAAGRSYGRRGQTPVIPGTGKRFGCNMISTITNRGSLCFMVFCCRFTTPVFLDFLRRLVRQASHKVFLIVDSHPVHKAAKVQTWLAQNVGRLRMFLLPTYSPELNPDELLNQDVKSNAVGRRRARDQKDLIANVRGYLRSTQRQPQIVRNYFLKPEVQYAAG